MEHRVTLNELRNDAAAKGMSLAKHCVTGINDSKYINFIVNAGTEDLEILSKEILKEYPEQSFANFGAYDMMNHLVNAVNFKPSIMKEREPWVDFANLRWSVI